ncbi:hypothetical protein AWZ03_001913 [Drosophila navojoa]|uniref:Uncharacterized protein n=1 Tax=Drosophila navojoa TaxID=7232 RepID=A0A484BT12_DRONA|nr:hypothetical protein AWZ03_001913 [Drosophila navojoa]
MASCSCQKGSKQEAAGSRQLAAGSMPHATGNAVRRPEADIGVAAAAAEQKSKADGSRCQLSDCQAVRPCQTLAKIGLASNLTTL